MVHNVANKENGYPSTFTLKEYTEDSEKILLKY